MRPRLQDSHNPFILTLLLGFLYTASVAQATIVECKEVAGSFTVFLSEPEYAQDVFQNHDQLAAFLRRLHFELDQDRDGRWVKSPNTDVRFVMCVHRVPDLDGQEFVPSLIDTMYSKRVLLEIWGELKTESDQSHKKLSAQMNYLLVPMKFAANQREPAPSALQRLKYSESGDTSAPDYVRLIARPQDIDAFVAAAFGFKLLREKNRELAHQNLCRASSLLKKVEERQLPARTRDEIKELRQFVAKSAAQAIAGARSDPNYSRTGRLWLQDPTQPCAGEE